MGRLDFLSHPCLDFVWLDLVEMHVVKLPCAHVCNSPLVSIHTAAVQLSTVSDILSNPSSTIIPEPCVYTCVCGGCVFVYVFVHVCAWGGCVCLCVHVCDIHRGQRTSSGAILSSTSSLRLLSPCLEFIQLLADQQTLSFSCLCLPSIGNAPLPAHLIFLCRVSGLPT